MIPDQPLREKEYHDRFYEGRGAWEIDPKVAFCSSAAPENRFIMHYFGDISGKTIFDAGAGAGEASLFFASQGAKVIWCDVSSSASAHAQAAAKKLGLEAKIDFRVGDVATVLGAQEDSSIDFIYGNGFLHHVDYACLPQVFHRVLKPGGKFAFIEPLKYNPAIWLYRKMAGSMRTCDERPLGFGAIRAFGDLFRVRHREFWLTGLLIFAKFYLIDRVHPSKEPYWKKIFYDLPRNNILLYICGKIDSVLARVPPLNYLCWNTVFYSGKNDKIV